MDLRVKSCSFNYSKNKLEALKQSVFNAPKIRPKDSNVLPSPMRLDGDSSIDRGLNENNSKARRRSYSYGSCPEKMDLHREKDLFLDSSSFDSMGEEQSIKILIGGSSKKPQKNHLNIQEGLPLNKLRSKMTQTKKEDLNSKKKKISRISKLSKIDFQEADYGSYNGLRPDISLENDLFNDINLDLGTDNDHVLSRKNLNSLADSHSNESTKHSIKFSIEEESLSHTKTQNLNRCSSHKYPELILDRPRTSSIISVLELTIQKKKSSKKIL